MTTYTCVFYMADGIESARGCVIDSWGSQFEMLVTDDAVEAAARLAHFHHQNEITKDRRNIGSFDIHLLINGRDQDNATDEDLVFIDDIHLMVQENLKQLRAALEAKKLEEARRLEVIAAKREEDIVQIEKELYAALKKKYGGS